jgi:hypothetical protein
MKTLILAGLLAGLSMPVLAADPACENTMESATAALTKNGIEFKLLPADKVQAFVDTVVEPIVGSDITNVTNVLVAVLGGTVVFGLEFDNGCVTNPIAIPGATAMPVSNV